MYLKLLNEEQKELFLDLALIIAQADGVYAESEVNTIQEYCYEMNIPLDRTTPKFTLNQLVEVMANSTNETEKRIIVFEALGLAMVDEIFDEAEAKIIELVSLYFCMENDYIFQCKEIINEYIRLQNKINTTVLG